MGKLKLGPERYLTGASKLAVGKPNRSTSKLKMQQKKKVKKRNNKTGLLTIVFAETKTNKLCNLTWVSNYGVKPVAMIGNLEESTPVESWTIIFLSLKPASVFLQSYWVPWEQQAKKPIFIFLSQCWLKQAGIRHTSNLLLTLDHKVEAFLQFAEDCNASWKHRLRWGYSVCECTARECSPD